MPLTCGTARYGQGVPEECTLHLDYTLEEACLGHRIHGTLPGSCLISIIGVMDDVQVPDVVGRRNLALRRRPLNRKPQGYVVGGLDGRRSG